MKSTGIVRKVDELGRIVIPKELRKTLGIEEQDPLEIFVDNDFIILRKYSSSCIFCGECDNIVEYKGKHVCKDCLAKLNER